MALSTIQSGRGRMAALALLSAGTAPAFLPLALAQSAHETAGWNSSVLDANTNYSGISFLDNPAVQDGATRGTPFPASEGNYNYANFRTINYWAKDYIRILSTGSRPIDARTVADLAARLKTNRYYTASQDQYATALESWLPAVSPIATGAIKTWRAKRIVTILSIILLLLTVIYYIYLL